jgi:two-component system, NtrC family, nitrogen regulation response regulator NtrX
MAEILVVDDEPNIRRMVGAILTAEGFSVRDAADGAAGVQAASEREPDAVLLDLMMPGAIDGMAALSQLRERFPALPVVMMSGRAELSDAVRATKLGAFHFLEKPLTHESMLLTLRSALELRQARREAQTLREEFGLTGEMVGTSAAIERMRELIARVAPTDATVLVMGESGTGKELVAAAIHYGSARREKPFIRVNCAAIPRDLVESEMFGHERGSFTGATDRRIGRFELADRGTLFMDEVGDLGAEAQAKLLRAIEAKEIERVGGGKPIPVNVRMIAATNKDLERTVADGKFREDLYFRLNVIPLRLAPLRERVEDIDALVLHFSALGRARSGHPAPRWTEGALALLHRYRWPGNVRELANIVERLGILHAGAEVTAADVGAVLAIDHAAPHDAPAGAAQEGERPLGDALDDYERVLITKALTAAGGNVAEAARRLRTDRPNLYRRMRRLQIEWNGA